MRGVMRAADLRDGRQGRRVRVAGMVITRQRPGTAKGFVFLTLEDETGIANAIIWQRVFEHFRPVIMGARLVRITGKLQSESGVIHVVTDDMADFSPLLSQLQSETAVAGLMPKGRNFH